jgi:hypothetical protein
MNEITTLRSISFLTTFLLFTLAKAAALLF